MKVAERPRASTTPTWRCESSGSSRPMIVRTSSGVAPSASSCRPFVPNSELMYDWVATAPTPAFAHGTAARTFGNFDWTATPRSPLAGSRAAIEKVETRGGGVVSREPSAVEPKERQGEKHEGHSRSLPSSGLYGRASASGSTACGSRSCANFPFPMAAPVAAPAALKRTPLYDLHRELGAKMVDFGGWDMPVQYSGILEEHRAVRERVGLFDVSHMGELEVTGPGAFASLQGLTPNDVGKLADGRIQYSAFLTEKGTFVDDLLVYRRAADSYLVVVNASNTPKDFAWATGRAEGDVRIEDRSASYALIAVQGPRSAALLSRLCAPDPSDLPYYGFRDTQVAGSPALVSRTGYTGEDGFEIYCRPEDAERLFRKLLEEGKPEGVAPCGLGARDTLRLEAKMALYGNDIDETVTAWEAISAGSSRSPRETSSAGMPSSRRSRPACRASSWASR